MSNRHFYLLFLFAAIFGLVVVVVFHFNNILRLLWLVVESCLLLLCFWLVLLSPQPRDFPFKHFDTVVTLGYQSLFLSHFSTLLTSLISHSACEDDTPSFNSSHFAIVSSHQTCAQSELRKILLYVHMFTLRAPDTNWAGPALSEESHAGTGGVRLRADNTTHRADTGKQRCVAYSQLPPIIWRGGYRKPRHKLSSPSKSQSPFYVPKKILNERYLLVKHCTIVKNALHIVFYGYDPKWRTNVHWPPPHPSMSHPTRFLW